MKDMKIKITMFHLLRGLQNKILSELKFHYFFIIFGNNFINEGVFSSSGLISFEG